MLKHHIKVLNLSGLSIPDEMFTISNSTNNEADIIIVLKKLNAAVNSKRSEFCLVNIFSESLLTKNKDDLFYNLNTLNLESCKFTDKIFQHGFCFANLRNLNLSRTVSF